MEIIGYSILALLLSGGAVALAITQATTWSWWHTATIPDAGALNGLVSCT